MFGDARKKLWDALKEILLEKHLNLSRPLFWMNKVFVKRTY